MRDSLHLRVDVRPSRIAGATVVAAAVVMTSLMAVLSLESSTMGAALTAIAVVTMRGFRQCAGDGVPASIVVGLNRRIAVTARDGTSHEGAILDDSCVGERLTTIVWRTDDAPWYAPSRTLLLLPDSLEADAFRRLRVILRYGQPVSDERASEREAG